MTMPTSSPSFIPTTPHAWAEANGVQTRWGWILAYAFLVLVLAVLAVMHPLGVSLVTLSFLGFVFIAYGIAAIAAGIRSFRGAARWFEIAMGTVAVGAGVATLVYPAAAAITVFMLFGASFFIGGILEILFTFRIPGHRAWRLFVGIIDVCLGGYLLTRSPEVTLQASVVLIAATVAISLFVRSAFFFALAFGLRRVQKS